MHLPESPLGHRLCLEARRGQDPCLQQAHHPGRRHIERASSAPLHVGPHHKTVARGAGIAASHVARKPIHSTVRLLRRRPLGGKVHKAAAPHVHCHVATHQDPSVRDTCGSNSRRTDHSALQPISQCIFALGHLPRPPASTRTYHRACLRRHVQVMRHYSVRYPNQDTCPSRPLSDTLGWTHRFLYRLFPCTQTSTVRPGKG